MSISTGTVRSVKRTRNQKTLAIDPAQPVDGNSLARSKSVRRTWAKKTLVVGPAQPVDGDSLACTKAVIDFLRRRGREAYTLPTLKMFGSIAWIVTTADLHPGCSDELTAADLQAEYDKLLEVWRPDEILLVDGQTERLGFDTRGVKVFTIDHHVDKGCRNDRQAYIQPAPATACLLISRYRIYDPILAVAIITDTWWFRKNHPATALDSMYALRKHGLTDELLAKYQRQLMVPKDPQTLLAIRRAAMRTNGDAVFVVLKGKSREVHREVTAEMSYFFNHYCVVCADGYCSFATKDLNCDLSGLAARWGGGGHRNTAAAQLKSMSASSLKELCADFMDTIKLSRHP